MECDKCQAKAGLATKALLAAAVSVRVVNMLEGLGATVYSVGLTCRRDQAPRVRFHVVDRDDDVKSHSAARKVMRSLKSDVGPFQYANDQRSHIGELDGVVVIWIETRSEMRRAARIKKERRKATLQGQDDKHNESR